MLQYEHRAEAEGYPNIAGIDEAGRGPLAGSVVASALVLPKAFLHGKLPSEWTGLNDSKKLSPKKREYFFTLLTEHPDCHIGVGKANAQEIDEINILQATYCAMRRAVENLPAPPDFLLVDGRPVPHLPKPSQNIIKGDSKSLSIAAASIVAKVTRDHDIDEADQLYPEYGFAKHKGYGTKQHLEALKAHGPSPIHRLTFKPVKDSIRN